MKTKDHERIIDIAFGPESDRPHLSDRDLVTLKLASRDVDSISIGQDRAGSPMHAMRGWNQSAAEAQALSRDFVRNNLQAAAALQRGGLHDSALFALGRGMHTIADSFSPEHEGFKPWCGDFFPQLWCVPTDAIHAVVEHTRDMSFMNREAAMALRGYYGKFRELSGLGP